MRIITWTIMTTMLSALLVLTILPSLVDDASVAVAEDEVEYEWALKEVRVNPDNARTEFYGGTGDPQYFSEERFRGKSDVYDVSETSITYTSIDVDYDVQYHDVSFTATFDKPPAVLSPGQKITLKATVSGSGKAGGGSAGIIFQYAYNGNNRDASLISISSNTFASDSSTIVEQAPFTSSAGDTFSISAGLWNCPACRVEWVYESREAGATADDGDDEEELDDEKNDVWVLKDVRINPEGEMFFKHEAEKGGGTGVPLIRKETRVSVTERNMKVRTIETAGWGELQMDHKRSDVAGGYRNEGNFFKYLKIGTVAFEAPPKLLDPGKTVYLFAEVTMKAAVGSTSLIRPWDDDVKISFSYSAEGVKLSDDTSTTVSLAGTINEASTVPDEIIDEYVQRDIRRDGLFAYFHGFEIGDTESDSVEPSFEVPEVSQGGTITITAAIDDCSECVVSWIYGPGTQGPLVVGADSDEEFKDREFPEETCEGYIEGLQLQAPYSPAPALLREGYVGVIATTTTGGVAHDYCVGGINESASAGNLIRAGDCIRTGDSGYARVTMFDTKGYDGGFSTIDVAENSQFCINDFTVSYQEQWRRSYWELLKGKIREFSDGVVDRSRNGIFSVKAGTTHCGIRGSDVVVAYDPDADEVDIYVRDGEAEISSEVSDAVVELEPGQQLHVAGDEFDQVETLSDREWDELLADMIPEDVTSGNPASPGSEDDDSESDPGWITLPIIIAAAAGLAAIASFLIIKNRRNKNVGPQA